MDPDEEADAAVFQQAYIPRCLDEVAHYERDHDRITKGQGTDGVYLQTISGLVADAPGYPVAAAETRHRRDTAAAASGTTAEESGARGRDAGSSGRDSEGEQPSGGPSRKQQQQQRAGSSASASTSRPSAEQQQQRLPGALDESDDELDGPRSGAAATSRETGAHLPAAARQRDSTAAVGVAWADGGGAAEVRDVPVARKVKKAAAAAAAGEDSASGSDSDDSSGSGDSDSDSEGDGEEGSSRPPREPVDKEAVKAAMKVRDCACGEDEAAVNLMQCPVGDVCCGWRCRCVGCKHLRHVHLVFMRCAQAEAVCLTRKWGVQVGGVGT